MQNGDLEYDFIEIMSFLSFHFSYGILRFYRQKQATIKNTIPVYDIINHDRLFKEKWVLLWLQICFLYFKDFNRIF